PTATPLAASVGPTPGPPLLREARVLTGADGGLRAVAASPDGKRIASGDSAGGLRLWEVATGQNSATFADPGGAVQAVVCSPDGALVATGDFQGNVIIWDLAAGRPAREL